MSKGKPSREELLNLIRNNTELNHRLMCDCDIYFLEQNQDTEFQGHGEIFSMEGEVFARDGSGGEFLFLEDGSIGLISSEGAVGRVSESLDKLLEFLICAGCISDFNCKYFYCNEELIKNFCEKYIEKQRADCQKEGFSWDESRASLAKEMSLDFNPSSFAELAMEFYKSATREPLFTCRFGSGDDAYVCDGIMSDIVGLWTKELVEMSEEEILAMAK
ncbi:Uncharacterised protein [[Eubacterium] infirmum]|nr:Uncharacterised protein [[Eubacterium] infirmum]